MACALLFLASFLPLMRGVEAGRGPRGLLENHCKEEFLEQPLDHFNHGEQRTFRQRYFVCQAPGASSTSSSRALFFYTGNEANVELYVEATGLMWEMAPDFGAMLVFAEHRYYGKSVPDIPEGRAFLSAVQALADYAELIHFIRDTMNRPLPAVCFGGSYGGMLCYWLRAFHPGAVSGAIAASAPVVAFEGLSPRANPYAYHEIVTAVADQYGLCSSNTRQFFRNVLSLGQTAAGRDKIASAMNLCHPLKDPSEATSLALWIQSAWDFIAMGNFPYASSYITNGEGVLPPWPMAAACASLEGELEGSALLAAMGSAVGVFYNATKDLDCLPHGQPVNNATSIVLDTWGYQSCTELWIPMSTDGERDMFWDLPWDEEAEIDKCRQLYDVSPDPYFPAIEFGGWDALRGASNVVFSSGSLDPWSGMSMTDSQLAPSTIIVLVIHDAAHHLDLFWSHESDSWHLRLARILEKEAIKRWLSESPPTPS